MRNGVIKMPQFLRFPIAKDGTKTIAHLPIAGGISSKPCGQPCPQRTILLGTLIGTA
jgi:hypothetical protein